MVGLRQGSCRGQCGGEWALSGSGKSWKIEAPVAAIRAVGGGEGVHDRGVGPVDKEAVAPELAPQGVIALWRGHEQGQVLIAQVYKDNNGNIFFT